jgi:cysteine desulfurase / selenocysteine lyase
MQDLTLDWHREFPILNELDFFNHAGVAPISNRAADALRQFADEATTRAYYKHGWYRRVAQVKQAAADLIGAASRDEIAFVSNTSTGISMIAKGLDWHEGDNVVISDVEYPANRYPWEDLKRFGVEVIEVRQLDDGSIDCEDVTEAITDRTRLVSISHVQYSSGCKIDLKPISDMVHRVGGYLCVDAIQTVGAMPVDVDAMGIDFLAADGHKWMLGPEGCGILYVREGLSQLLHPNVVGWMNMVDAGNYGNYRFEFQPDARRFEPGSYNLPGIFALGASLALLNEVGIDAVWSRIESLTTRLCEGLAAKGYRVFSPRGQGQRSGIVVFEPRDDDKPAPLQIVNELENQGIVIVIREGKLRASPHFYNTIEQMDRLVEMLP